MKKFIMSMFLTASVFGFASTSYADYIIVQKGDSMWKIAKRYNVSFSEVLRLNRHYDNQHLIYAGDKIELPEGSSGTNTTVHSSEDEVHSSNKTPPAHGISDMAHAVLLLVNNERSKNGLHDLTLAENLTNIATTKAKDMAVNHYFSHDSPTYGSPFKMLQDFGVSYKAAGENIAAGQKTANEVMNSWMNSSGHRANILSPKYTQLGVGYYVGGSYGTYWVQTFIKP